MTNHPTRKARTKKWEVKAVKAWAWVDEDGSFTRSSTGGPYLWLKRPKYPENAPITIVPGHIGKDFKIVPLPRSRKQ